MVPSTIPPELNQPIPRRVAPHRKMLLFFFGVPFFTLIWVFGTLGIITVWPAMKQATLKERGIDTVATLEAVTPQRSKGGSIFYNVSFHYTLPGEAQPVYQGSDKVFQAPANALQTGASVPALYDPQNPTNVKININNAIRTNDPYRIMAIIIIPVGGFAFCMFFFLPMVFIYQYGREKKFLALGSIGVPTLTSETEYNAGRAGTMVKIAYRFMDTQGRSIDGERKGLPTAERAAKYPIWQKKRDEVLKNPIVIYDPNDSAKNMLYPGTYAVCVVPAREWGK